ncbi:uncharacterized protein [Haliotis asinina]|uniref:uncharacterized protein n=1 Tax=Haliotis asinina TaxID=109174 RepID=UPI003531F6F5
MYRQRHRNVPRLPASRPEIHLEDKWAEKEAGERFLHRISNDILLFTTDKNMKILCDADTIYCDGTFFAAPRLFHQIYTIQAQFQGHMFPLVYGLLPDRKETTYSAVFEYLHQLAETLTLHFSPPVVQLDFQLAAHNAVRSAFSPTTHLRGCFFHYCQCLWRRVQKENLVNNEEDNDVRRIVRRAAALPLCPLDKVDNIWLDCIADSFNDLKLRSFMDYVTASWVEGNQFSPLVWNHFGYEGPRTNNHLEGSHHKLNQQARKSHPNIFEVVGVFKREQSVSKVSCARLTTYPSAPQRKCRYRQIDSRLRSLSQDLRNQDIDDMEYVDCVSELLKLE